MAAAVKFSSNFDSADLVAGLVARHLITIEAAYPAVYRPNPTSIALAGVAWCEAAQAMPGARILELGTGSGIVALAAACGLGHGSVIACDISGEACDLARAVAKAESKPVDVRQGDWFDCVAGETFDLILCHPPAVPYAQTGDWGLPTAIRVATESGPDGTRWARYLTDEASKYLRPGGKFILGLPHWCDMNRVMGLLRKRFGSVFVMPCGEAPFFPISDGTPDQLTLTHFWHLSSQGSIEVSMRNGFAFSPISVVIASL